LSETAPRRGRLGLVRTLAVLLFSLVSCGPPLAQPDAGVHALKLSFDPSGEDGAASNVVRIRLEGASPAVGAVELFTGSLSSYSVARIKSGELPDSLAVRQVPVMSWRTHDQLLVAPTRPLAVGAYSLAGSSGLLGQFQVTTSAPLLTRLWPPASSNGGLSHAIYCGDGSAPLTADALDFEPAGVAVLPARGIDESEVFANRCFHLDASPTLGSERIAVPPPRSGVWALDPAPFSGVATEPALALTCSPDELPLALGCALVEDDRAVVRTPSAALLWVLHSEQGTVLEVTQAGASFVLRGLTPSSSARAWGNVYDLSDAELPFDATFQTSPARERPVLNELLANPLGPEPQSEWIELVNDGTAPLDLAHFSLRDSGGSVSLPDAILAPHELVLLTRQDFAPNASDVPPAPDTRLIRLPTLGTAGLSNSGEGVALIDAHSVVVSSLPPLAAKAGQSLARRHTYSQDADPSAFTVGTPTPGALND